MAEAQAEPLWNVALTVVAIIPGASAAQAQQRLAAALDGHGFEVFDTDRVPETFMSEDDAEPSKITPRCPP